MAEIARTKINISFPTDTAARVFDYLAEERGLKSISQVATYCGSPVKDVHEALESLGMTGLVNIKRTGMINSETSMMAQITVKGLNKYEMLKKAFI